MAKLMIDGKITSKGPRGVNDTLINDTIKKVNL